LKQAVTNKENFGKSEFCSALSAMFSSTTSESKTKTEFKSIVNQMEFETQRELKMFVKTLTGFGNLQKELQENLVQ